MKAIAITLKLMNIYAHNCHNIVAHVPFFQDHEFLAEAYAAYDDAYDSVIERMIGLDLPCNLVDVHILAVQNLQKLPQNYLENKTCFQTLSLLEEKLCQTIEQEISAGGMSEGTRQLLGDICDKSEARQYKIKQRLK